MNERSETELNREKPNRSNNKKTNLGFKKTERLYLNRKKSPAARFGGRRRIPARRGGVRRRGAAAANGDGDARQRRWQQWRRRARVAAVGGTGGGGAAVRDEERGRGGRYLKGRGEAGLREGATRAARSRTPAESAASTAGKAARSGPAGPSAQFGPETFFLINSAERKKS